MSSSDLVEGTAVVLGVRLPLGARPTTASRATSYEIPAPVDAVDRYLRARLSTRRIDRSGSGFVYESAKPVGTEKDGELPLHVVVAPSFAGTKIFLQQEATGIPVRGPEPEPVREERSFPRPGGGSKAVGGDSATTQ